MKIKCIAIDDEPPAILQMEEYISRVPFLELLHTFDNGINAIEFLKENIVIKGYYSAGENSRVILHFNSMRTAYGY